MGGSDSKFALALMRHGVLLEVGFEIGDVIGMFYKRITQGEKGASNVVIIINLFHHSMACGMAIPMNLYYGDSLLYAEFVLVLQSAAGFALLMSNFGFTIDVKSEFGTSFMF